MGKEKFRIENFLKEINLEKYTNIFKENDFESLEILEEVNKEELKEMGLKIGERNVLIYSLKVKITNKCEKENLLDWLKEINLETYLENFLENGITNLMSMTLLSRNDFDELGIKNIGHRIKIYKHSQKTLVDDLMTEKEPEKKTNFFKKRSSQIKQKKEEGRIEEKKSFSSFFKFSNVSPRSSISKENQVQKKKSFMQLDYILKDEKIYNKFKNFSEKDYSYENIVYWELIQKFRKTRESKEKKILLHSTNKNLNKYVLFFTFFSRTKLNISISEKKINQLKEYARQENENDFFLTLEKCIKENLQDVFIRFMDKEQESFKVQKEEQGSFKVQKEEQGFEKIIEEVKEPCFKTSFDQVSKSESLLFTDDNSISDAVKYEEEPNTEYIKNIFMDKEFKEGFFFLFKNRI
jgi:hypothetical protein